MPNLCPPVAATYLVGQDCAALFALSGRGAHTARESGRCGAARQRAAVFYDTLTVTWHHVCHMMPNLHLPVAATYLVGRERAALFALSGRGALPTLLEKVNVAGQRDREVQSFMAPPQSYDTTCVT